MGGLGHVGKPSPFFPGGKEGEAEISGRGGRRREKDLGSSRWEKRSKQDDQTPLSGRKAYTRYERRKKKRLR